MAIQGNTQGIKDSLLQQMEQLSLLEMDRDQFASPELLNALAGFTARINREISVYITRDGEVIEITIGDNATVPLAQVHLRRSLERLSGVRCIHTHPSGDSTLSSVDIQSLISLKFDAMAALGVNEEGRPTAISIAFLDAPSDDGQYPVTMTKPYLIARIPQRELMGYIDEVDKRIAAARPPLQQQVERALLVGLADGPDDPSLIELERLAETAGAQVVGRLSQSRARMDSATYIGRGKAEEVALLVQSYNADIVIFDDELTGAQVRNLEAIIPCRILDRTALILDIFAQRATSREGKLQVELAQMRYRLPRLTGLGVVLSRLGGGIGTRGPGETKLEVDRRRIRRRITDIERDLGSLSKQRDLQRSRRQKNDVPVAALVGYTNSGKSTILNLLSDAGVVAEDKLFATLDPVTRRIRLPGGTACLLTDTVGFINKLPHDLIRAFRSTLEEAMHADLLLIVHDVVDENYAMHAGVVEDVLKELGAGDTTRIHVLNKADLAEGIQTAKEDHVLISAKTGFGVEDLLAAIEEKFMLLSAEYELLIPYARGDVAAYLHKAGQVQGEEYEAEGTKFAVRLQKADYDRVQKMLGNR